MVSLSGSLQYACSILEHCGVQPGLRDSGARGHQGSRCWRQSIKIMAIIAAYSFFIWQLSQLILYGNFKAYFLVFPWSCSQPSMKLMVIIAAGNYCSLFFVQDLAVRESARVGTGILLKEPNCHTNPTGSRPFYSRGNLSTCAAVRKAIHSASDRNSTASGLMMCITVDGNRKAGGCTLLLA